MIEENNILIRKQKGDEDLYHQMRAQLREVTQIKNTLQATTTQLEAQINELTRELRDYRNSLDAERNKNQRVESQNKKLSDLTSALKVEFENLEAVHLRTKKEL